MKKISLLNLLLVLSFSVFAQNENEAVSLLNHVKDKTYNYQDVEIDFDYLMENTEENIHQKRSGKAYIKKEKFQLQLGDIKIIFDGKRRYSIIDDEVTITSQLDESGINSPIEILNMYKDGYMIKMDIVQNIPGKAIQFVRLTPIDSESQYKYILIGIDKSSKDLHNVIYTDKNDTQFKLEILKMKTNAGLSDSFFTFDKNEYPEDEYMYTDLDE
jgi:outer membrane lipoprotein-sorting protein